MTAKRTARKPAAKPAPAKVEPTPAPVEVKVTQPANCGCGCGKPTVTVKALFLSGHDARHAGNLGRTLAANPADEAALKAYATLSTRLQAKVDGVRLTAAKKAAAADARKVAKVAADKAYAEAMAACEI